MNGIRNQIDTLWFMVLLNLFLSVCSFCGDASLLLSLVIARFDAGRQRWWQEGSRAVTAVKNRWHSSTVTCKCNPKFIPTRPPSEQKRVNKHWIESFKPPACSTVARKFCIDMLFFPIGKCKVCQGLARGSRMFDVVFFSKSPGWQWFEQRFWWGLRVTFFGAWAPPSEILISDLRQRWWGMSQQKLGKL